MDGDQSSSIHARSGSSSSLAGLSVNRQGAQNYRPATNGEQAPDTLSPVSVDGSEPASPSKAGAMRALDVPPPPPPQPGLIRRAWRNFPSASAWVTVGFASLLLYLTVARKCTDGEYPEFCRLVHMQSNVDWVSYRKTGPRDPTRCNAVLDFPRVAMMFLSAGEQHHEETWRDWFRDIGGLVPRENLQSYGCTDKQLKRLQRVCGIREGARPLDRQYLFNVYTHPSSSYKGHPKNSVFYGREIPNRIHTSHGAPALMDAIRALLRAALAAPHNQQFLLLSESEIPLYPAVVVWRQLIGEEKSRINACKGKHVDQGQFPEFMPKDTIMQQHDWRKSPAWFGLQRKHAELAVADVAYLDVMRDNCKARTMINHKWRMCFLDEHYIPSLLAFHGLDNETDCRGGLVTANWTMPKAQHPIEYHSEQIGPKLFKRLRIDVSFGRRLDGKSCKARNAIRQGLPSFVRADEASSHSCRGKTRWSQDSLQYKCPLFARKFRNDTAKAVHEALIDCEAGLKILDLGDGCS